MKFNTIFKFISLLSLMTLVLTNGSSAKPVKIPAFGSHDFTNEKIYDAPVTNEFTAEVGIAYRNMAGIGYVDEDEANDQLIALKLLYKTPTVNQPKAGVLFNYLFKLGGWERVFTYTNKEEYNYSYSVLLNTQKKKVVCTFSGTKESAQLAEEALGKDLVLYDLDPSKQVKIVSYFSDLYVTHVRPYLHSSLKNVNARIKKDFESYQFIFTGHSLGGAIATIAVYDSLVNKIISTRIKSGTPSSPVLITYGQPRTGNYVFANEVSKVVPTIHRIVNDGDAVAKVPPCKVSKTNKLACHNEFAQPKLKMEINFPLLGDVNKPSGYVDLKNKGKHYYWHIRGLIVNRSHEKEVEDLSIKRKKDIYSGVEYTYCGEFSEPEEPTDDLVGKGCGHIATPDFDLHTKYYGYQISEVGKANFGFREIAEPHAPVMYNGYTSQMFQLGLRFFSKKKKKLRKIK